MGLIMPVRLRHLIDFFITQLNFQNAKATNTYPYSSCT